MQDVKNAWKERFKKYSSKGGFIMREYFKTEESRLHRVICNCCGRELKVENGYLKEECISVDQTFGYFSAKDGQRHRFDICEDCYDKWLQNFAIPVEECEENELL